MSTLPDFSSRAPRRLAGGVPDRLWALAGAGLLLASSAAALSAHRGLEAARAAEADARQAAGDAQARLRDARGREDPARLALAARARLASAAPPPRVLADLQAVMPAAVRLEQATLVYGQQVDLELRVAARTARAYDEFLERLQEAPAFRTLSTGPESREGELRALIRLRYAPEDER